jgi:hypothetical protein
MPNGHLRIAVAAPAIAGGDLAGELEPGVAAALPGRGSVDVTVPACCGSLLLGVLPLAAWYVPGAVKGCDVRPLNELRPTARRTG